MLVLFEKEFRYKIIGRSLQIMQTYDKINTNKTARKGEGDTIMRKNFKKAMVGIVGIAAASVVAFTGCGLFGGNNEAVQEETQAVVENVDILTELAENEALVDTKIKDNKIVEYFTDGTFVERDKTEEDASTEGAAEEGVSDAVEEGTPDVANEKVTGKVIVHTPKEKVIRDKEGLVKVADVKINTDNQNLIFKDNKIVVQEKTQEANTPGQTTEPQTQTNEQQTEANKKQQTVAQNEQQANVTPTQEKIVDVVKIKEEDIEYTVTEYEKTTYDKAFEERETFVEAAKDTDEKIEQVINKEVTEVVQEIKKQEEEAKKQAQEEAKAQDVKDAEVKKDDKGNTVITGKDNEGDKVEIVTDKQGNTEVKKTDDAGKTVAVAPIVQPQPTQPKPTEAPKPQPTQPKATEAPKPQPTQPKATQPAHTHNWQPVYKTVHHDAVTHQETYTEKEPYTYTEKEPYTYQEPFTYTTYVDGYRIYESCTSDFNVLAIVESKDECLRIWDDYADNGALNDGCYSYQTYQIPKQATGYRTKTGYKDVQKTGYKDVKKTRTVTDKAAWDEKVVDYYKCSCGARK